MTTGQLRAVVTANRLGSAACGDDLIEHPGHAPAGETSVHFERQTLPRVDIDHTQHANHASCGKHIMSEIQGPLLVSAAQYGARRSDAHTVFSLLPLQAQTRLAVHPPQPFMVHSLALTFHQHLQSPIAVSRLLSGQSHQLLSQRLIRSPRLIPITAHCNRHQPAHPALTGSILRGKPARIRPPVYELNPFFAMTAFSISLSRLRSATRRFRREFSSSSERSRCASLTSRPPNFAFQVYIVAWLTPHSRATSSTVRPASTCFSAAMICASVCLLLPISPSPESENHTQFCADPREQVRSRMNLKHWSRTFANCTDRNGRGERPLLEIDGPRQNSQW